ncbi:hypothetical protein Q0M94_07060 [Deinococcus radiomollis]|uniref:hypothetical protein n=1 Tax=Deinococcus radiomollis TaxID=468916 RepID=UPI0038917FA0
MAYRTELGSGQTIFLEQQGEQTSVQVHSGTQSQGSSFQTGVWKNPPRLYRADGGLLLEIRAEPAVYYRLEGSQLHSLGEAPALEGAEQIELKEVLDGSDDHRMKPMEKMEPMKPMDPMKPM